MPHKRKTKDTPPVPGHEGCSHTYRIVNRGLDPAGDHNPRRQMIFRAFCIVANRWMSVNVSHGWFWEGTHQFGTPSASYGEIDIQPVITNEEKTGYAAAAERERLRQLEAKVDQIARGPDTDRGGR